MSKSKHILSSPKFFHYFQSQLLAFPSTWSPGQKLENSCTFTKMPSNFKSHQCTFQKNSQNLPHCLYLSYPSFSSGLYPLSHKHKTTSQMISLPLILNLSHPSSIVTKKKRKKNYLNADLTICISGTLLVEVFHYFCHNLIQVPMDLQDHSPAYTFSLISYSFLPCTSMSLRSF